jgi:hypothetical protein
MSDVKNALYVFLLFVIIATPLYYLSGQGMEAMTGHVTSAGKQTVAIGDYRIKPDFKVTVNDPLADYSTLRTSARKLVTDVQGCTDMTGKCVEKLLPQGWSTDCGTADERLFASVVEGYLLCAQSEDNYCTCEIPVTFTETNKGKDYEISIDSDADITLFSLGDQTMTYSGRTVVDLTNDGKLSAAPDTYQLVWDIGFSSDKVKRATIQSIKIPAADLEWYLENVRASVSLALPVDRGEKLDYSTTAKYVVYKTPESLLFISPEERTRLPDLRTCQPANKQIYRFCVDSKKGSETITYRFALDFSDATVPVQPSFAVADAKQSKQSLTVSFSPSADKDIDHYDVYCSKSQYSDLKDMPVALRVVGSPVPLTVCPEQEKTVPIVDGTTYYVSVIAVDRSNNYQKTGIRTQGAVSVDDTSPPTTI